VNAQRPKRLMSIGEFASATQLSPKALRLYDEQRLLQPARIDPANGYRYYRSDQVAAGRLVRTLREMNLPLTDVARVMASSTAQAEILLGQFAKEVDLRYAREKRSFQAALLLLREAVRAESLPIEARARPAFTVAVHAFMSDRRHFFERSRIELDAATTTLAQADLEILGAPYYRLIEPLSDEDAQIEILVPVATPAPIPGEVTLRQLPAAAYVAAALDALSIRRADFTAAVDALFDWFDRGGHCAIDAPWVSIASAVAAARIEISRVEIHWAYESNPRPQR
jgi:DNA-binding transcriptional MerR regulator